VCPENALTEKETPIGTVYSGKTTVGESFFFAHGILKVGESLAPNVVRGVKRNIIDEEINIIDASPGTACPVVEAVDGADVAVLVTEPTPFGLNDLKLAVGLSLKMGVPTGIIVNRSDGVDNIISDYAEYVGVPIVGRIPFKREYAETYSGGGILVTVHEELRENLLNIYDNISALKGTVAPAEPEEEMILSSSEPVVSAATGDADDYKEITIISGKGGTGKTTVVSSFAMLAENKILTDNDVDAADLHLLINPSVTEAHEFIGSNKSVIDAAKCVSCGRCAAVCHFDAINMDGPANDIVGKTYKINHFACEACGYCELVCPVDAISSKPNATGMWYISDTDYGPMTHAKLGIAEENSGKLVTQVRNKAAELALKLRLGLILGDGPPGTGCPVIASVSGTDMVVIVTEPTVSGVHDMERVMDLCKHFGVPALVIINKADLNAEQASKIEQICVEHGSRVIAHIPFDRNVNDALMAGQTVIEYDRGEAVKAIRDAWASLKKELSI
jgi:MinD superfamily P-loop ATPase